MTNGSPPRRFPLAGLLSLAALLIVPLTTMYTGEAEQQLAAREADTAADQEIRNRSAIAVILGEFRANLSDLVFIKTESWLHNGVRYLPHLDYAKMADTGEVQAKGASSPTTATAARSSGAPGENGDPDAEEETNDSSVGTSHVHGPGEHHHHDDASSAVVTVIKPKEEDFRGFIGDLEREVKPWLPPGSPDIHTAGTELLPWYRLATLGNPQNERAYMIGAWWLKSLGDDEQVEEALRFVAEGITNNPKSFQLYLLKGYLERQLDRDDAAVQAFVKAAELGVAARPPGGARSLKWTESQEDQAIAAMTMAALATRDAQSPQKALELVARYESRLGTLPKPIARIRTELEKLAQKP